MKPTVLHVLEALEGGTARHVVDIVTTVRSFDHEVVVPPKRTGWVTDEAAVDAMRDAGATVHLVDLRRQPLSRQNVTGIRAVRDLIRRRSPAVLHGHSSIGGAVARIAGLGTPVATCYTPNGLPAAGWATTIERLLGRRTDALVAVSTTEAGAVLARNLVRREAIVTIPNGIVLDPPPATTVDLRSTLGIPASATLVGTVSRLVPQKAPEVLVAAFEHVARASPETHFLVIGSGPQQSVIDDAANGLLQGRLHQIRVLPHARSVLDQLDVFVLASRFEGGPYAPLEAMAARTAVVLTDVVGNRDVVEAGRSGLLVPPGDPEALGDRVFELIADVALRERIAAAGRARVEERFDVDAMAEALAGLYARLAAQASGTVGRRDRR